MPTGSSSALPTSRHILPRTSLVRALGNSIWVSLLATAIVVPLAFVYAYALTRSCMPFKGLFTALALLPIFAPSLLAAISLIYIFGNQGFLKGLLLGNSIYGPIGIVFAEVCYCFPHAVMIIATALRLADGRLYEVAAALGTPASRVFYTVTLPGARYGLVSAAFVVFTLIITDFGIPKVIGGQFNVLATDAYKQIVGQQNFEMGAVVGLILLMPAILAFAVDRQIQKKQVALLSARAVPYEARPAALRDGLLLLYCIAIGLVLAGMLGMAVWASFITYWPYNLSLSLKNYEFSNFEPGGWGTYFLSLQMAGLVAIIGTAVIFSGAYLIEKTKVSPGLRGVAHLLAMLPMAVPGLVLGLGYVFFVNAKWNPLNIFYGTLTVLVVNTIAAFLHGCPHYGCDSTQADRRGIRGGFGFAEGAFLGDIPPGDRADLDACHPRHCGLYVRQCADHDLGGCFSLWIDDKACIDRDRSYG